MNEAPADRPESRVKTRRDIIVAVACGVFVAGMVGLAYASVPFYDWFCRATGFGGRTQVAAAAPGQVLGRTVNIRFDTNVAGGLPWRFEAERTSIEARLGDVVTVAYTVTNVSPRTTTGIATYNVTPPQVGGYFNKINCFCFTDQQLAPGERRELTVVFFVDPELVKDAELDDLNTITLSYTVYPVRQPDRPVAESTGATPPGRITN